MVRVFSERRATQAGLFAFETPTSLASDGEVGV
jgi:hypothetical protein